MKNRLKIKTTSIRSQSRFKQILRIRGARINIYSGDESSALHYSFTDLFFNLVDLEIEYSIAKNHKIHEMFSEMIKTSLRKRLRKKNRCASVIAAKW